MSSDSTIAAAVERQMRNWELSRRQGLEAEAARAERDDVADFITISRRVGSTGGLISQMLGKRLGWPVFDREILHHMANDDAVRTRLYEKMDERDTGWIESVLRWLLQGEFRREDYFVRLSETVLALARQGPAIFLGRGVDLILPRERGLRVRLTASEESRVAEYAEQRDLDEKAALAEMKRIETDREAYLRHHFNIDPSDPMRFDVVVNLDRFSTDDVIEMIVAAARLRGVQSGTGS